MQCEVPVAGMELELEWDSIRYDYDKLDTYHIIKFRDRVTELFYVTLDTYHTRQSHDESNLNESKVLLYI